MKKVSIFLIFLFISIFDASAATKTYWSKEDDQTGVTFSMVVTVVLSPDTKSSVNAYVHDSSIIGKEGQHTIIDNEQLDDYALVKYGHQFNSGGLYWVHYQIDNAGTDVEYNDYNEAYYGAKLSKGKTIITLHFYPVKVFDDSNLGSIRFSYYNGDRGYMSNSTKTRKLNILKNGVLIKTEDVLCPTTFPDDVNKVMIDAKDGYKVYKTYDSNSKTFTVDFRNEYTVTFNGNGSTSGTMSDQKFVFGEAQDLTANAFQKDGYTITYNAQGGNCGTTSASSQFPFTNWDDNNGNQYTDKQNVNNLTTEPNGQINLYAQWGELQNPITLPSATKTGYSFLGWYTDATEGTRIGGSGDKYSPTSNITLFAQWKLDAFDITIKQTGLIGEDSIIVTITASGSASPVYVVSLDAANPSATIKSVPAGDYAIVEKSWSHAYTVEPASFNKTLNQNIEVTFVHTPKETTPNHAEKNAINWKINNSENFFGGLEKYSGNAL